MLTGRRWVTAGAAAHDGGHLELGPARPAVAAASTTPADIGRFSDPFAEPTVAGRFTDARCITDRSGVTPGPYLLFVNRSGQEGPVPSVPSS